MKSIKKWLAALLVLLMMISLIACSTSNDTPENGTDPAGSTDENRFLDNLPDDLKFNGETVVIHTRDDAD